MQPSGVAPPPERHNDWHYAFNFTAVTKFFVYRQQDVVDNQEAVSRMIGDEGKFVRVQPQVQCVEHARPKDIPERYASRCSD